MVVTFMIMVIHDHGFEVIVVVCEILLWLFNKFMIMVVHDHEICIIVYDGIFQCDMCSYLCHVKDNVNITL